jgi:hypothetical protein
MNYFQDKLQATSTRMCVRKEQTAALSIPLRIPSEKMQAEEVGLRQMSLVWMAGGMLLNCSTWLLKREPIIPKLSQLKTSVRRRQSPP